MPVQRIDNPTKHTHGWQARWPIGGKRYLSKLCSDSQHGGMVRAYDAAVKAEQQLKRKAARQHGAG
jgi:hypothetical protein